MSRNAVYIVGIVAVAGLLYYLVTVDEANKIGDAIASPFKTVYNDIFH